MSVERLNTVATDSSPAGISLAIVWSEDRVVSKLLRRFTMKIENSNAHLVTVRPAEMPIGLVHFDSDFCWCDPIVEVDEHGRDIIIHREVTWN
jgi:hypothetical protein